MKLIKIMALIAVMAVGEAGSCYAQELLPEIVVSPAKYKYLSAVTNKELPQPVKMLEKKAAEFDIKNSEYYDDEYDEYYISFFIPEGYILATYDRDGKLIRTAEKYKNVALPGTVAQAIAKRFPQWTIPKDVYLVSYQLESGASKMWKLILKNGNKRLRVKLNEKAEFLD